jgi:hypothetical protein
MVGFGCLTEAEADRFNDEKASLKTTNEINMINYTILIAIIKIFSWHVFRDAAQIRKRSSPRLIGHSLLVFRGTA